VGSFLVAAGVPGDTVTEAALDALATLQCLEILAATPRRGATIRGEWAARVAAALGFAQPRALGPSHRTAGPI
jgi:hypothetical protein